MNVRKKLAVLGTSQAILERAEDNYNKQEKQQAALHDELYAHFDKLGLECGKHTYNDSNGGKWQVTIDDEGLCEDISNIQSPFQKKKWQKPEIFRLKKEKL